MTDIAQRSTPSETEQDYYSILVQVVAAVSQDHAQLRAAVYELARLKLRKDLSRRFNEVGWSNSHEHLRALDAAINQCEAEFEEDEQAHVPPRLTHLSAQAQSLPTAPAPDSSEIVIVNDYQPPLSFRLVHASARLTLPLTTIAAQADRLIGAASGRLRGSLLSTVQLIIAAALGATIFTLIDEGLSQHHEAPQKQVAVNTLSIGPSNFMGSASLSPSPEPIVRPPEPIVQPPLPGIPLPSTYGVYAVSDGRLTDLDALPIRVPDLRVAISSEISTPSRAHLPSGQLKFVVFRRDLLNNAPDHAELRVVARIERALTFNSKGKPTVKDVGNLWAVRNNSYPMKVAPVAQNREMIMIQPEDPQSVVSPGRYVLVFNNLAYDFSVDGPLTDTAHCLERTDAVNGPVYTECRHL